MLMAMIVGAFVSLVILLYFYTSRIMVSVDNFGCKNILIAIGVDEMEKGTACSDRK